MFRVSTMVDDALGRAKQYLHIAKKCAEMAEMTLFQDEYRTIAAYYLKLAEIEENLAVSQERSTAPRVKNSS
jgi:Protein of unknown function (DUF3077)